MFIEAWLHTPPTWCRHWLVMCRSSESAGHAVGTGRLCRDFTFAVCGNARSFRKTGTVSCERSVGQLTYRSGRVQHTASVGSVH